MATAVRSGGTGVAVMLRTSLWLVLGGWVGAWLSFALLVARVAFEVLPSDQAGQVIGPVLAVLHWYGAVAGVMLAVIAWALGRGPLLIGLPLVLCLGCLVTELGVTPQIAGLRDLAFGPGGNTEAAVRFNMLHQLSLGIFGAVLLGALWLLGLHARRDALSDRIP